MNTWFEQRPDGGIIQKDGTHKEWLDHEYGQWITALQESTVHNFKEHPMVQRMLSEDVDPQLFKSVMHLQHILLPIDNIGRETVKPVSGACLRMAYYALKVIEATNKIKEETGIEPSIVEIGGGVGQFYAVLKALGWEGEYEIMDLPEVKDFQLLYLLECEKRLGLSLPLGHGLNMKDGDVSEAAIDMLVSFYALGEFDNETKQDYLSLIHNSKHGLILWNPHSGASEEIPFECIVTDEEPKSGNTNVKMLTW